MIAGKRRAVELLHQRMHTESQLEIEHRRAEFDQEIVFAGLSDAQQIAA